MANPLTVLYKAFLDVLAPDYCEVCSKIISNEKSPFDFLCQTCFDNLPLITNHKLVYNNIVSKFKPDELSISEFYSLFSLAGNSKYMNILHALKYRGIRHIGKDLGYELGRYITIYGKNNYDYIIPLPIHSAKKRERGYNQSDYIAQGISKELKVQVNLKIIKRHVYTRTQTELNHHERKANVANVFVPYTKGLHINGKSVLLVDDVLTTGSSLNSAATVLLEMGAVNIEAATLLAAMS